MCIDVYVYAPERVQNCEHCAQIESKSSAQLQNLQSFPAGWS